MERDTHRGGRSGGGGAEREVPSGCSPDLRNSKGKLLLFACTPLRLAGKHICLTALLHPSPKELSFPGLSL